MKTISLTNGFFQNQKFCRSSLNILTLFLGGIWSKQIWRPTLMYILVGCLRLKFLTIFFLYKFSSHMSFKEQRCDQLLTYCPESLLLWLYILNKLFCHWWRFLLPYYTNQLTHVPYKFITLCLNKFLFISYMF